MENISNHVTKMRILGALTLALATVSASVPAAAGVRLPWTHGSNTPVYLSESCVFSDPSGAKPNNIEVYYQNDNQTEATFRVNADLGGGQENFYVIPNVGLTAGTLGKNVGNQIFAVNIDQREEISLPNMKNDPTGTKKIGTVTVDVEGQAVTITMPCTKIR